MALNNDGIEAGSSVAMDVHQQIKAEHRLAKQKVIRNDSPDLATALAAVRSS